MDKKAVMQETYDGKKELLAKLDEITDKLYDLRRGPLDRIRDSLIEDVKILKNGEPFWDGLTEARIAIEQEDYLLDKSIVDKVAELVDKLCDYVEAITQ